MSLRSVYAVAVVVFAAMLGLAGWGLAVVGPDAVVPTHWGVSGEADGYASALVAFLTTPTISVGILVLLAVIPRIEPRRENLARSASAYRTVMAALLVFMALVHAGVVLAGTGHALPMGLLVGGGIGALFMVLGNVMTTVRSNYMFGVRTPWTLSSDLAWDKTHRLVGRLFFVAGLAVLLLAFTGEMTLVIGVMLAFVVVVLVVAFGYSYRVWRSDPDRRSTNGS